MKTTARRITQRRTAKRSARIQQSRKGTLMIWSIWVFLAMLMIVACFLNVSWLSCLRSEARRHAESAAIVGGHAYLSDDILRLQQQPFEHEGRAVRCRAAAVDYIRDTANPSVIPRISQEDIELVSSHKAIGTQEQTSQIPDGGIPQQVRVCFGKHQPNEQLRMFFGSLTGIHNAKIGVVASARIEHTPVGFQPGGNLTIPILPFAIPDKSDAEDTSISNGGIWSEQIEAGRGADNMSWNPSRRVVEQGPDGLPEITMTITPDSCVGGPDQLVPLMFAGTSTDDAFSRSVSWMQHGITTEDLNSLGMSTLPFPSTIPAAGLSHLACGEIVKYLQVHLGQSFIVCLCAPVADPPDAKTSSSGNRQLAFVELHRPVAARIMAVGTAPGGGVHIRLQPCVLITSTAIMSHEQQATHNRYIYSVRLCD